MGSRTWIKVYCDKWLYGTLREDPPDIRGVWIDLLALAGSGQYGDTGEIKLGNGVGFTDGQICAILRIGRGLWRKAKQRFQETQRIEISPRGAIRIVNWAKYQSEYQRQKPYRQAGSDAETRSSTPEPKSLLENTLEKEKESKKLQVEVTTRSYSEKGVNDTTPLGTISLKEGTVRGTNTPPPGTFPRERDGSLTVLQARSPDVVPAGRGPRILEFLARNGGEPHRVEAICVGIGESAWRADSGVRYALSAAKKRGLVTNVGRGLWALTSPSDVVKAHRNVCDALQDNATVGLAVPKGGQHEQ